MPNVLLHPLRTGIMPCRDVTQQCKVDGMDNIADSLPCQARRGMFRTCDRIDAAKARQDAVLLADARTSMSDYRLALAQSLGRPCDRNGFTASAESVAA